MTNKLNPSSMPEYGYLSVLGIGNINMGITSNLALDDFLYPLDNGNLGLFLHPEVDSDDFLSGLNNNNIINENLDLTIASMGFYSFGGFSTFDISLHQSAGITLKKSIFEFLVGSEDGSSEYQMGGSGININSYVDVSLGHAHRINERLTVGAKVKFLVGLANADITLDKMDVITNSEMINLNVQASGKASVTGIPLVGSLDEMAFDSFDLSGGLNTGMAFDFGATYEWDRFTFSAAVTDLGWIKWSGASKIEMGVESTFEGFEDLDINDFEGSTEGVLDDFLSPFEEFDQSTDLISTTPYTKMLSCQLNLAAEYDLVGDKISAGLLSTTTFGTTTITELMLVANLKPVKWFNVALSGTVGTVGSYCGWVVSFCPRLINFYIGSDCMLTSFTPQFVPYNSSNFNINFGVSIPVGRLHEAN